MSQSHEVPSSDAEKPFQVVVRSNQNDTALSLPTDSDIPTEDEFSLDEIEAAYLRALENAEFMDVTETGLVSDEGIENAEAEISPEWEVETGSDEVAESETVADEVEEHSDADTSNSVTDSPASQNADYLESDDSEPPPISEEQVLEALLFVGGEPLPTKKLIEVLGGSATPEHLDELLNRLNTRYLTEGRPYEIRLLTGGYVLQLREEFEAVRNRVYGFGPKEVKLAQDALEVLALIAYRQPASQPELEEMGRPNLGPILRQLLRRQLVYLERSPEDDTPRYRTTPRFLELFGLQSLDDLPQAGDFQYK